MGTKVHNNYEDLITFTRASTGHALRPISYGDELVTNGDFSSTDLSDWTTSGTGAGTWAVTSGTLGSSGQTSFSNYFFQDITCIVGNVYYVSVDVVTDGGNNAAVRVGTTGAGGQTGTVWEDGDGTGTFVFSFVATSSTHYVTFQEGTGGTASAYDNISVKEVTFDQPDGTLTLFEHPDNIPRVEYDADRNRLGLLVEESRTNLITYSEDLADSSWNKGGSTTVTTNFTESPDKQDNGVRIQMPASSGTYASRSFSATSGTEYTISLWAKDNGGGSFNFGYASTVSSGVTDGSTVTATGEWVRYSHTFTAPSTGTYYIAIDNVSNTSAVDALIFGVQLEAGSFPTSYIKTTGSTATRSADVASIPVADFGYNQSEGSIVIESQTFDINDVGRNFSLSDGTSSNVIRSQTQVSNHLIVFKSGTLTANLDAGSYSDNVFSKLGGAFAENDIAACIDGGTVATDTSSSIPTVTKLNIGGRYDGGLPLNGHIKSIKYYPRRLTNAQLQEITT